MRRVITGITATMVLISVPRVEAVSFQGLGDLSDGTFYSLAYDISADGSVVVGYSGHQAFRWTRADGMEPLPDVPGGKPFDTSVAYGVSGDGSVVVGSHPGGLDRLPFRWTEATGSRELGGYGAAVGVSDDGSVVVGTNWSLVPGSDYAWRWTENTGQVPLGELPPLSASIAGGVSANGSVVVGYCGHWLSGREAFRWTEAGGMEGLGHLSGGIDSAASAVSDDGSVVVGSSDSSTSPYDEAFRWTEAGGMEGLGYPPGSDRSSGSDVSADGSAIVGSYSSHSRGLQAFIWDNTNGMRNLTDVLVNDCGLDLTGWQLVEATAVSSDGLTIGGNGRNPLGHNEAWIAIIPEPSTLALLGMGAVGLLAYGWRKRRRR